MIRILFASLTVAFASSSLVAQTIVVRGSDTLGDKLVPMLVDAYKKASQAAEFDVIAEGSTEAFTGLLAGTTEIGMSSRPIKDSEKSALMKAGHNVSEHVAGVDMIAVIVNEANTATNASVDSIGKIFSGSVTTWKTANNAPIKAFTRDETSGTYKVFQELAMAGAAYGASTIKLPGNGDIAKEVAAAPGGVGYVGLSYAKAPGVKALMIDGVTPDPKNSATYPLSRKLFYYTIDGKVSDEAMKFVTWATTDPAASKIVEAAGFIPAK